MLKHTYKTVGSKISPTENGKGEKKDLLLVEASYKFIKKWLI